MKKIIKLLISILIVSMLAATAISAATGPYTGCLTTSTNAKGIFYNFQPGSTPISTCGAGDYQITIYEKTYIDSSLSFLQNQINSLVNRITNLENNQRYFQGYQQFVWNQYIDNNMKTIDKKVFNIPGDSNVYVEISGWEFSSSNTDPFYIAMDVDQDPCPSGCWTKDLRFINPLSSTGIQRSEIYRLSKGSHTIYLDAGWSTAHNISMTINYNLVMSTSDSLAISTPNKNTITTMKDGKLITNRQ